MTQNGIATKSSSSVDWRVVAIIMLITAFGFGMTCRAIPPEFAKTLLCSAIGGIITGLFYQHRFRGLGLAAFAYLVAFVAGVVVAVQNEWSTPTIILGISSLCLAFVRCGLYVSNAREHPVEIAIVLMLSLLLIWLGSQFGGVPLKGWLPPPYQFYWLPAIAGLLTLLSAIFLYSPAFQLGCETMFWIMYRVRAVGPGVAAMPPRGPCIVIANHACWFDPFFLGKMLPRPITPMMISSFYDLPVMRWIVKNVFHAIRVPDNKFKKQEMPDEVREAIAALDRGDCLVIFPEGALRRSEEKPLKRFGRGVWQVLAARPDTPVYCCWLEGTWRSYTSYFNGYPTKNKKFDWRRKIDLAVPEPIHVAADVLTHHLTTRLFLMNRVLESRKLLGLQELPPVELPKADDDGE